MEEGRQREYYRRRAPEHDTVYERDDTARCAEQRLLASFLQRACAGRSVLDVGCGTGWWMERYAPRARRLIGLDPVGEVLTRARERVPPGKAGFVRGEAERLPFDPGRFEAVVATFLVSHVERRCLASFLGELTRPLAPGGRLLLADNRPVPGIGGPPEGPDELGDTWKVRTLADGSRWRIRKNYHSREELEELLAELGRPKLHFGAHFWWAEVET